MGGGVDMVGPIRFDGIASGIDFTTIIQQITASRRRPIDQIKTRIQKNTGVKTALLELSARLLSLKVSAEILSKPSFFNTTKASSSNESLIKASGNAIAALGTYTFTPAKLAQAHSLISNGFADSTTTPVTTTDSEIRIEVGGGFLDRRTRLADLNGGAGVDRGSISVTNGSIGVSETINLEGAVTVQDVLDAINSKTSLKIKASVSADKIVLEDTSGVLGGTITVTDLAGDTTAADLGLNVTSGLVGPGVATLVGKDINSVVSGTSITRLNDGLGVKVNAAGLADFTLGGTLAGAGFSVDLAPTDDTVGKVISKFNAAASAAGSSLRMSISGDGTRLVIAPTPAATGTITITQASDSNAAVDLGFGVRASDASGTFTDIAEETTAGITRLVGNRIVPELNTTLRNLLNGGMTAPLSGDPAETRGIRDGSITITDKQGDIVTLDLSSRFSVTLAAAVGATPTNSITVAAADLNKFAVGNKFRIVDDSGVTHTRVVTRIDTGTNQVFFEGQTGIANVANTEARVFAHLDSLQDIANLINDRAKANNVQVRVELNDAGNAFRVVDYSGGTGTHSIVNAGGSLTGSDLGIVGSATGTSYTGTDIDVQYLSEATPLSKLNQGAGVTPGKIQITDTNGTTFTVDLSQPEDNTLGRVISEINSAAAAAGSDVRARINATGDGLEVRDTDATPGSGTLKIIDPSGGRTARDLGIAQTAPASSPTVIDGSFEKVIKITANSKLQDVVAAINSSGLPLSASVINDGSPTNPFKLSMLSKATGEAGRLVVTSGISGLSFSTTTKPQDAVLIFGTDTGPTDPTIIQSSSNVIKDIVPGLTLELLGTSSSPVQVTVSRDTAAITRQAEAFAKSYNEIVTKIKEFTAFDTKTFEKGVLFGEGSVKIVERDLARMITQPVGTLPSGSLNTFRSVGFELQGNGQISFDAGKFESKLNNNFNEVVALFTAQRKLNFDTPLKDFNNGIGVKTVEGNDFKILTRNPNKVLTIDVTGNETVNSLLNKINFATGNGGQLVASISSDGFSIELTDSTTNPTRTAEGGSTTTIVDSAGADNLLSLDPDAVIGAKVTIVSDAGTPANNGLVRTVTGYDPATGTITLDNALPGAIDSGDTYTIQRALSVKKLNNSEAAANIGIEKTADFGANVLKGNPINLKSDPGLGFRSSEILDALVRTPDGLLTSRSRSIDDNNEDLTKDIERLEASVKRLEERLIIRFARLEQFLAQSQQTMQRLQMALMGLQALGSRASSPSFPTGRV